MSLEIRQIGAEELDLYAEIPGSFRVERVLRVEPIDGGLGGLIFAEEEVQPYTKWDEPDEESSPMRWPELFRVSGWGIFIAFEGVTPVGGVAVGPDAPGGLTTPFERGGTAVLWDIRVHPVERRRGVATKLFRCAIEWAMKMGYDRVKMEVSSANLPMCRFCAKKGCELVAVHRRGYETAPKAADEAMLIWYYELL